jgi:hypothetical protein
MTNERLEKAKFYLKEAHALFDFVQETRRKVDEKTLNVILLSGTLINIVVGLGYFSAKQNVVNSPYAIWLLVASACLYLVTAIIGIILYRPQDSVTRNIREVIKKYEQEEQESELALPIEHLAWNLSSDAQRNSEIINQKAKGLMAMLITFAVGLAFLIGALVLLACGL